MKDFIGPDENNFSKKWFMSDCIETRHLSPQVSVNVSFPVKPISLMLDESWIISNYYRIFFFFCIGRGLVCWRQSLPRSDVCLPWKRTTCFGRAWMEMVDIKFESSKMWIELIGFFVSFFCLFLEWKVFYCQVVLTC